MLKVGTLVRADRWDLEVEALREHLGTIIEFMPHRAGDSYGIATTDGQILDVLAAHTTAFSSLDAFLDAVDTRISRTGVSARSL